MGIWKKIKKLFGAGKKTEIKEIAARDKSDIPKYYKKQVGIKDGQIQKLQEDKQKKEKVIQKLQKKLEKEKKKKEKEKKRILKKRDLKEGKKLSMRKILHCLKEDEKSILVLSREHTPLGYLYDFKLRPVEDKLLWQIITFNPKNGKKLNVMDGFSLQKMIHRPEGFVDVLESGFMVINRSAHSRSHIPDTYVMEYGSKKNIENLLQEKEQQINQFYNMAAGAKKDEQKERTRRKFDNLDKQMQKTRADVASENALSAIKDIQTDFKNIKKLYEEKESSQAATTRLTNLVKSMQQGLNDFEELASKNASKDDIKQARDSLMEDMKEFKEIIKNSKKADKGEE